jgi:hypothetical protein
MVAHTLTRWLQAAAAALALAWPGTAVLAQDEPAKPLVLVAFDIQAPKFQRLPERDRAGADLAARLAAEFGRRYPFADWVASADPADARLIGRLTARLVESPGEPGALIEVLWLASFGAAAVANLELPRITIYETTNPDWDTHNRANFVSRVSTRVLPQVASDGFQQQALTRLVQRLPIAASIEPDSQERVVTIPRLWRHLQLGQESTLRVVFSRRNGEVEQEGSLVLVRPSQRARDPGVGRLQAAVQEAAFASQTLVLTQGWNTRLPTLLGGATVACYIRDYRPKEHAGTLGALALVPD